MPSRNLAVLLLCATVLFTGSAYTLSLLSLDDCFYARKGIEQARSGRFFTVTWNYHPAFQNPPLQFWVLGRSFVLFGENDFSARLPSILMAMALLLLTYRIGRLTVGSEAALTGVALLLLSPAFVSNARRCMLEIPTTFWIATCFWILLEGLRRPKLHLILALPLGAALLTKSVLGLLPAVVYVVFAVWNPEAKRSFRRPWLWMGLLGGIAIGASWPIDQWQKFGEEALRNHYLGEIAARSTAKISPVKRIFGYPLILLGSFQPAILPALAGLGLLWKERAKHSGLLFFWMILPVLIYTFSSAQSSRYVFPIFPALALVAGFALNRYLPRFEQVLNARIAPALLLATALLFWVRPQLVLKDENAVLKQNAHRIQQAMPAEEPLTYAGDSYWKNANPVLYYTDRLLEPPVEDLNEALMRAKSRSSGLLLCDREKLAALQQAAQKYPVILENSRWTLIRAKN